MDSLDLDAFIANIEQSAPKEEADGGKPKCQECDTILEEVEGNFVCPNCSAQATEILQLDETELHYNEAGVAIVGQRVKTSESRKKHIVDYGWAWSTDEAIVHILGLQMNAIEEIGLVPEFFRLGIKNMWLKFWVENVAPYIKDEYNEQELVPISVEKALKLRDVEVLVKIQDKVMIPKQLAQKKARRRMDRMMGTRFYRVPQSSCPTPTDENCDLATAPAPDEGQPIDYEINDSIDGGGKDLSSSDDDDFMKLEDPPQSILQNINRTSLDTVTRNLSCDSISILTLNRALAFIEAAARCIELDEPLFASDIIRACNQRLIPFFGAQKTLPNGLKLNTKDRLLFQKNRPPSPVQLTRTASLLVHKIYNNEFPLLAPVPNLETILKRFLVDMNLPHELLRHFKSVKVDFSCFKHTKPLKLINRKRGVMRFPQYDRWAFAILLFHLKRLFVLDEKGILEQSQAALTESQNNNENLFVFCHWARQMSMRLQLIMSYDQYMLFHPMADMKNLQPTPQVYNYIETLLSDRTTATTYTCPKNLMTDETFRSDMTEFLKREIPRPPQLDREMPDEKGLQKPIHLRHPIQDAFIRTKRFWISEICHKKEIVDLLFQDFSCQKIFAFDTNRRWSIYDDGSCPGHRKFEISPNWPYCFRLLLSVGSYICYCEPKDLLNEYRYVEGFAYPHTRAISKARDFRKY